MEQRMELEMSRQSLDWKRLRRGWCWGPKGFREEMLELIGQKQGKQHYGEELKESDEHKAQRLLGEMLQKAGWRESEVRCRRKGDVLKARIAARRWVESMMTWSV